MNAVAVFLALFSGWVAQAEDVAGTFLVDPVELVRGNEIPGKEDLAVVHGRYEYLFASEQNKAAFEKDPDRYEIQLGGACGRMGPLSGAGSTDLYAVYGGRIYIFASEGCRRGFLAAPEKMLETDDPVPQGSEEATRRGRELLDKALQAIGGAEKIDALTTYQARLDKIVTHEEKHVRTNKILTLLFPDGVRQDQGWGVSTWAAVAGPRDAFFISDDEVWTMHAQQRAALEQIGRHEVLSILHNRNRPDFVAVAVGKEALATGETNVSATVKGQASDEPAGQDAANQKIDDPTEEDKRDGAADKDERPGDAAPASADTGDTKAAEGQPDGIEVELVAVAFAGTTTTLGIDPATGRIHSTSYRGRGPDAYLGTVKKVFSKFRTMGGLTLPSFAVVTFEGEVVPDSPEALTVLTLNAKPHERLFLRP